MRAILAVIALVTLGACVPTTAPTPDSGTGAGAETGSDGKPKKQLPRPSDLPLASTIGGKYAIYAKVVARIGPEARHACFQAKGGRNCNFQFVFDERPEVPSNAFQTLSRNNRPIIVVTAALLDDMRNDHELAMVLGHEAAHHIKDHIEQQMETMQAGALMGGLVATVAGASEEEFKKAREAGALIGARRFSKDHEFEADYLGAIIAERAGYDALIGAELFFRLPNPRDQFLASHPPNPARRKIVLQAVADFDATI